MPPGNQTEERAGAGAGAAGAQNNMQNKTCALGWRTKYGLLFGAFSAAALIAGHLFYPSQSQMAPLEDPSPVCLDFCAGEFDGKMFDQQACNRGCGGCNACVNVTPLKEEQSCRKGCNAQLAVDEADGEVVAVNHEGGIWTVTIDGEPQQVEVSEDDRTAEASMTAAPSPVNSTSGVRGAQGNNNN